MFGNAGGGKSTLARRLAEITGIPLYVIDVLRFPNGGPEIAREEYSRLHAELLTRESWIIDGFENAADAWQRFACADTLIHVDLPLFTHFRWVTKRFVKGLFATPAGWPEGTPLLSSTVSSYRVLWPCHRHLTPKYRALIAAERGRKNVHHLRSAAEMEAFLDAAGGH